MPYFCVDSRITALSIPCETTCCKIYVVLCRRSLCNFPRPYPPTLPHSAATVKNPSCSSMTACFIFAIFHRKTVQKRKIMNGKLLDDVGPTKIAPRTCQCFYFAVISFDTVQWLFILYLLRFLSYSELTSITTLQVLILRKLLACSCILTKLIV